jgi:hypothetical protein
VARFRAARDPWIVGIPCGDERLPGPVALGDQQADRPGEALEAGLELLRQSRRRGRRADRALETAGELPERDLAGRQARQLLRVPQLAA